MAEKILSISVAAYNVEKTIREVLDSLSVPEILDRLEVFVVDDGGSDGSLAIAQEYESRYPDTFHAVHKENGGYGSTVNYSVIHATGKYFRLLDGDDWFAGENLPDFISLLERTDAELVVTPYIRRGMRSGKKELYRSCKNEEGMYPLENIIFLRCPEMYCLTWRTSFLRSEELLLKEHCMYTDAEYAFYPFLHVKNVYCWQRPIYIYRTEVAGQSMSLSGKLKHEKEYEEVFWGLVKKYKEISPDNKAAINIYKKKLIDMAASQIRLWCWKETSPKNLDEIKDFYKRMQQEIPEIARGTKKSSKLVWGLVSSRYIIYPICNRYCLWKFHRLRGGD